MDLVACNSTPRDNLAGVAPNKTTPRDRRLGVALHGGAGISREHMKFVQKQHQQQQLQQKQKQKHPQPQQQQAAAADIITPRRHLMAYTLALPPRSEVFTCACAFAL